MVTPNRRLTWYGQAVAVHRGLLANLMTHLPTFSREPFGGQGNCNEYFITIVREPVAEDRRRMPVAIVSHSYELIQHRDLLKWLAEGLAAVGLRPDSLKCMLFVSPYAERMFLRVLLEDHKFDPGDGYPLGAEVHVLNSVDKSTPLQVSLAWWRQVCSNGMKMLVANPRLRRIHLAGRNGGPGVGEILKSQFERVGQEHCYYRRWFATPVDLGQVEQWADDAVARAWGPYAAARLCHIVRTGCDGNVRDRFARTLPHLRPVESRIRVPGAPAPARNAYHVSQALSWLASRRDAVEDQLARTEAIHRLMVELLEALPPPRSSRTLRPLTPPPDMFGSGR